MEMNNKAMGALLFLAGVMVGVNYPKIKKQLQEAAVHKPCKRKEEKLEMETDREQKKKK